MTFYTRPSGALVGVLRESSSTHFSGIYNSEVTHENIYLHLFTCRISIPPTARPRGCFRDSFIYSLVGSSLAKAPCALVGVLRESSSTHFSGIYNSEVTHEYQLASSIFAHALPARSNSFVSPIFFVNAANDPVGPFHRSSSTSVNTGSSVRRVARRLNSNAFS
jgi:hypothetical protein